MAIKRFMVHIPYLAHKRKWNMVHIPYWGYSRKVDMAPNSWLIWYLKSLSCSLSLGTGRAPSSPNQAANTSPNPEGRLRLPIWIQGPKTIPYMVFGL